jgi:hypothetical protein
MENCGYESPPPKQGAAIQDFHFHSAFVSKRPFIRIPAKRVAATHKDMKFIKLIN